jgi:hypothetical protein
MTFVLTEIRTFDNVRRYYFDVVAEDQSRRQVTVGADLDLIRRYRIPLQELPLLCRRLLEGHAKIETTMFTESDMQNYVSDRTAETNSLLQKRKARRPQVSNRVGQAWRGSPPRYQDREG